MNDCGCPSACAEGDNDRLAPVKLKFAARRLSPA